MELSWENLPTHHLLCLGLKGLNIMYINISFINNILTLKTKIIRNHVPAIEPYPNTTMSAKKTSFPCKITVSASLESSIFSLFPFMV